MATLTRDIPVTPTARSVRAGLGFALLSAMSFGLSGTLAKGLLEAGWTPGAAVTARISHLKRLRACRRRKRLTCPWSPEPADSPISGGPYGRPAEPWGPSGCGLIGVIEVAISDDSSRNFELGLNRFWFTFHRVNLASGMAKRHHPVQVRYRNRAWDTPGEVAAIHRMCSIYATPSTVPA